MEFCQICNCSCVSPGNIVRRTYENRNSLKLYNCSVPIRLRLSEKEGRKPGSDKRMFIFGVGFVGTFFAKTLKKDGWEVSGTCTSSKKMKELEKMGFNVSHFDTNNPEITCPYALNDATHILISIPPTKGLGDPLFYLSNLVQNELYSSAPALKWLGYLSSTSVYGDCGGIWVDEDYPANPQSESAKARFVAEKGWLDFGLRFGVPVHIFRLGGVYGPGRSVLSTIIKEGTLSKNQLLRGSKRYIARVHVADICQALMASIGKPSPGRIYNVVDDDPASRAQVIEFAISLMQNKWNKQIKINPFQEELPSKVEKVGDKRVTNTRLKKELRVDLLYPTYRDGLLSIAESTSDLF